MASSGPDKNDRELKHNLAHLFDAVAPSTRAEAEEELRTAGVDPDTVGQRLHDLAHDMLSKNGSAKSAHAATPRRTVTLARASWAIAALLLACLIAWALMPQADGASGLLQRYRERLLREQRTRADQHAAVKLPRAERAQSAPEQGEEATTPVAEATLVPPTKRAAEAAGSETTESSQPLLLPMPVAEPPLPLGGLIALAGDIPPGEVITARNIEAHNAALSPGLQWAVHNGVQLRLAEARSVVLPAAYRQMTELFANQARIGPDGLSLRRYTAGLPFPAIDLNDAQAGIKVMWNHEYRPFATDDMSTRDFTLESGVIGEHGARMRIDRRIVFGAFRRLFYNGRVVVDPKTEISGANGVRYREGLYPVTEPHDLRGTGFLTTRDTEALHADRSFMYVPALSRVRRISVAARSDGLLEGDPDPDSFFGFSGQLGLASWRLVGHGEVPGCMHAVHQPVQWGAGSADFVFDDVWEMRPVFVVEGRYSFHGYAFSKRVLYIDQETWVVLMSEMYDRAGELKKVWLNMFSADDATGALDNPAAVMIDVQHRQATRITMPAWEINQGEKSGVTEGWFTLSSVIENAR